MAIYTGFFDAAFDEATGTYDREYGSADFTGYFGQIVGSGVCVHGNDDSMRVYYDAASKRAVVNPGYLFIRGYWLKNDGLYTVDLADLPAGVYAIRAALNLGTRSITIGQVPKATPEEYPDALVLAYATVAEGGVTVEDTRGRTDICGLIDAAGSLSVKVDYAIHYIDNEINGKLDQIQQNLQAQEAEIDGKIAEANGLIAKIAPPAVGTIKFSASQDIEEGWLRCDGKFINEADYPELVAALGKNYPSGDKFQPLNTEGVGTQISNGVVCEGRIWVFSYADRKLYGIDLEGNTAPKIVELTSDDPNFSGWQNPNSNFLALSIIPNLTAGKGYHLFLSQMNGATSADITNAEKTLIFYSSFGGDETSLKLEKSPKIENVSVIDYINVSISALPYVISRLEVGIETFYIASYQGYHPTGQGLTERDFVVGFKWTDPGTDTKFIEVEASINEDIQKYVILGFMDNNLKELVVPYKYQAERYLYYTGVNSYPEGTFNRDDFGSQTLKDLSYESKTTPVIAGDEIILLQVSPDLSSLVTLSRTAVTDASIIPISIPFPSSARPFLGGCAYLWGKKMFMIFVGTGILFSRDLSEGSFGYLDTTSVLGTITQYASVRYSQDEGSLYIVGQDTTNTIRAAKIVLNTLYDYASDGAWLPLIASDGIPAYIKAIGEPPPPPPVVFEVINAREETGSGLPPLRSVFDVTFDGKTMVGGKNMEFPANGTVVKMIALQDYTNPTQNELSFSVKMAKGTTSATAAPLVGKVLAKGEQIKKGTEVETTVDMARLHEQYPTGTTVFYVSSQGQ